MCAAGAGAASQHGGERGEEAVGGPGDVCGKNRRFGSGGSATSEKRHEEKPDDQGHKRPWDDCDKQGCEHPIAKLLHYKPPLTPSNVRGQVGVPRAGDCGAPSKRVGTSRAWARPPTPSPFSPPTSGFGSALFFVCGIGP